MKIVFLPQSATSLRWFHRYYATLFPAGKDNALARFNAMKELLRRNPEAGRLIEGRETRVYVLPKTPFSVLYRLRPGRIEVLAVFDEPGDGVHS